MPGADHPRAAVPAEALHELIPILEKRGYQVIGPVLRDGAIVYDRIRRWEDLPAGWGDQQEAGRYRLQKLDGGELFGYTLAPQSWKRFLHPPEVRLFEAQRENGGFRILDQPPTVPRYAFLGVRACELAAIALQDRVLLQDRFADPVYQGRRNQVFLIAVQCTHAAPTCFCASLDTGPKARSGFDLALTEVSGHGRRLFVIDVGSPAGAEILAEIGSREASPELCRQADAAVEHAAAQSRRLETAGLREALSAHFDHPRWEQIAGRCLSCANCTQVCPTCFCTTVEDSSDVAGAHAERRRKWDSCFTQAFSYIHGGSVRMTVKSCFRQWMTHKLASWVDQFGSLGCVGCGRCITWCPAGIDITEEARAIREAASSPRIAAREVDDGIA